MKKEINICPIVVVGAWNRAIFTPEWVKKYILTKYDKFQIRVPETRIYDSSLQFVTPDFAINIIGERLEFRMVNNAEHAIECLRNILRILPHTPITSMGINTTYSEDISQIPDSLKKELNLKDDFNGLEIISIGTTITLKISEQSFLNISISKKNNTVTFDFNYDFKIEESKNIFEIIGEDDTIILKKEKESIELLTNEYGLRIE